MGEITALPFTESYIQNRMDRFNQEFLQHQHAIKDVERLIGIITEYISDVHDDVQSDFLYMTIVKLNEAIFWIHNHNSTK